MGGKWVCHQLSWGLVTGKKGDSAAEKVARTRCRCLALRRLMSSFLPGPQWGVLGGLQAHNLGWRGPEQTRDPVLGPHIFRKKPSSN